MEKKHMSAFELYKALQPDLPPPAKKSFQQVKVEAKKKKKKVNGSAVTNVKKSKTNKKKIRNKLLKAANKEEGKPAGSNKPQEVEDGDKVTGESLDALLAELTRVNNSRERASLLFQWLIRPVPAKAFFSETWEKKPVFVPRKNPDYYKGLFSTAEFDRILREENVQYGVNLDITSYVNGKRETHNPPGRALPFTVWDFYESGCSVRLLNPQAFCSTVWNVLSILQEQFGSMAGANVYLTPPGTQGFAPHYDDIEAFVVQLEGKKHWRVYNPRSEEEVLPVLSSPNFDQAEIGKPILDVVLEAGDLLYFPRGFIHQGNCLPDAHSLHITISSYQKNSWGDLLQKVIPAALGVAMEEDVAFRRGLPLDYLTYMGVQNSDKEDPRRAKFLSRIESLMKKLPNYAPVDAAVDQKAKEVLHDCLPPVLTPNELATSVQGAATRWADGTVKDVGVLITTKTQIKIIRAMCARLCSDGDAVHICYTTDNSRVYHKEELQSFEIQTEHTDAVEFLIHSYPKFVTVESLPCDSVQDKIALAELLFEKGIIHTAEPLKSPPTVHSH
ncbi:PREDICTED: bifunctional lysine-specific demethylase and histidyl-hydroxylase NO66-like [Cyprinodon variegatus]|uniref:bifunctional lysine-specific demethylase and histidyl-hydroxylase NO66-like n=1 Tax=Cyprinodon variegatus TaxID=28743 RepID=UPI000742705B|nr:PREDICTED: bifunctional lysine-specific demethylase and histidyl-hydroxylase NO66-like [Cyprinodon variegatus]